jgi:5-amino-6-(5-phosphoribosylamino)uracil reductase/diaminohydroxyphosphoribosylaminopyrimidine deaminase/5-amino-6-(5-phosphoribosylamino)uracil reductase
VARPFVTIHFAQSLDGHLDDSSASEPIRLSNDEGFRAAHRARANHDAVLVGIDTVLRDDPRLLTSKVSGKHPHRVVLDSRLRTPNAARLLEPTPGTRTFIFGCESRCSQERVDTLRGLGADVHLLPPEPNTACVPLLKVLECLARVGVKRLLVEGGARVIHSFLRARCVDWMQVEIVPRVVGVTGLPGLATLGGSVTLEDIEVVTMDKHVLLCGKPSYCATHSTS